MMPRLTNARIITVLGILWIAWIASFAILSPDLYWHLKMGEDFLTQHLSLFIDHYSFTENGAEISRNAWPFQIIVSLFHLAAGDLGICIMRWLIWSVGFYYLLRILRSTTESLIIQIIGTGFFLLALAYHSEPRPDLLSLTLELFTIEACIRWRKNGGGIFILCLVFALWSNYHVSSAIGYVILAAFFADQAIRYLFARANRRQWILFLRDAMLLNVAGFLNHDLMHPIMTQAALSPKWAQYIVEYATRPYLSQELYLQIYWILLLLTLPLLARRREGAGILIILIMADKTWAMSKLFPHLIVMTIPFVAQSLEDLKELRSFILPRKTKLAMFASLAAIVFALLINATFIYPIHTPLTLRENRIYFPADTVDYYMGLNYNGNIFNQYAWGGYLLYRLAPNSKVFIDGRTNVLYPLQVMERYENASTNQQALRNETQNSGIDWIIAPLEKPEEIIDTALNSRIFSIEFIGNHSALLTRKFNHLPVSSISFLHPECALSANQNDLVAELKYAKSILPSNSPLLGFLQLASTYRLQPKETLALLQNPPEHLMTALGQDSYLARLAAVILRTENDRQHAVEMYAKIHNPSNDDKIIRSELDCEINQCRSAEALISTVKTVLGAPDHGVRVLRILRKVQTLGIATSRFPEIKFEKIRERFASIDNTAFKPTDWCHPSN